MAKSKKNADANTDGELGGYAPSAPGIHSPFVVAEGGHEGARAVYEYQAMAEGRIDPDNDAADKFRDYDSCIVVSKGV